MKRFSSVCLSLILMLFALFALGCTAPQKAQREYTVRVLLPESDAYDFFGAQILENGAPLGELSDTRILDVRPGQSVRFAVTEKPGTRLSFDNENLTFENGFLTLSDVRVPVTLEIFVDPIPTYTYNCLVNVDGANVISSVESGGKALENTTITMTAIPSEKQIFLGFSKGNFLREGGELLTEEETYSFDLVRNTDVYANFEDWSLWRLNYHRNGGKTADGTEETLFDAYAESFYYCPNTRPDKGFFTRDGYVLTGYNTKPDGTGQYYGLGWNVIMPESGVIDLYCQWEKAADASLFEYTVLRNSVSITGYTGDDTRLIIPETIEGKAVTTLSQDAFLNASFREVYIPKSVRTIDHNAFNRCTALEKVYLSDSVKICYDDSFYNCPALRTLVPEATEYPHSDNDLNFTYQVNYERLITRPGKIMLIVSGSTNVYGLTAKEVEDALDNEWDIITYATVASTPATMYAEIGLSYLDADDLLILTPEASPYGHPWGTNYWEYYVWQIFEGAYDAIPLIDISNYTKVFSAFSTFNQTRFKTREKSYEYHSEHLNEYGEYATFRPAIKPGSPWVKWDMDVFFTEENVENYNRMLTAAKEEGLTPMIGWLASVSEEAMLPEARIRENQLAYMNRAEELYDAYFFGDIKDYIYEPKYVHDQAMHLNTLGCEVRTKQIIKDIKAALTDLGLLRED